MTLPHVAPCCCPECETVRAYDRHRHRMITYGRWQPFVPAGRARAHAAWLRSCGLGPEQIGRLAGVSGAGIVALLDGKPGRQPTRQVRPETEAAILAVRPRLDVMSPGTLVDPAGTRHRVQALAWCGWPIETQGQMAGVSRLDVAIRQAHVSASCARQVRGLYDKLWDQPPPRGTAGERRTSSRARAYARRQGWAPPGAWDDDEGPHYIDNPAAVPAPGWDGEPVRPAAPVAAALIREARQRAGLSQRKLAVVLGVSKQAVWYWEAGRRSPEPENWVQLELALGPLGVVRNPEPGSEEEAEAA